MSDLPSELELFEFENKLRSMISELVNPIFSKFAYHEEQLGSLVILNKQNEEMMKNLEVNFQKTVVKMLPAEQFNKIISDLYSQRKATDTENSIRFEGISSRVDFMNHQFSDMQIRVKSLEENNKNLKRYFDDQSTAVRKFKEETSAKLTEMEVSIASSSQSNIDLIETFGEQIRTNAACINEINQKALPELSLLIEKTNPRFLNVEKAVRGLIEVRVLPEEITKLQNKIDYDIKKSYKLNSQEIQLVKEYLDKMLRVEISCGISDTLLQILDARQIKKLIPVVENQLTDYSNSNDLVPDDSDTDSPILKSLLHTKTLGRNKEMGEKILEAKAKLQQEDKIVPRLSSFHSPNPRKIDSEPKSPDKPSESERPFIAEKPSSPPKSFTEEPVPSELSTKRIEIVRSDLPSIEEFPRPAEVPSIRADASQTSLLKEIDDKSSEVSFDPIAFQEQLIQLTVEVRYLQSLKEESLSQMIACSASLKDRVSEAQREFCTSVMIMNEENKQLAKQRLKDLSDINATLHSSLSAMYEKVNCISSIEERINRANSAIQGSVEAKKMIYKLLAQDEEDRKSLQLTGYIENKQAGGKSKSMLRPKLSVSIKPECMSCTGQNPLVFTAFKMACLNYSPSDLQYGTKTYQRKELIQKLGEAIERISEGSKGMLGIERVLPMFINDESSVRLKSSNKARTASRYILDVSSSKLILDPETPIRSRREIKSMHKYPL